MVRLRCAITHTRTISLHFASTCASRIKPRA